MTIDIDLKDSTLDQGIKQNKLRRNKPKGRKLRGGKREKKSNAKRKDKKSIQPQSQKKRKRIIIITILLILFLGIGFLIYRGYLFSHNFGFRFQPVNLLTKEKKELRKDSSGNFTNVLLVGIDTRENGGLLNTDTIILASYNYTTHNISLISIPRDFHVEVQEDVNWYARINSLYSTAEQKEEGLGIIELQKSVESLTGQEIQYYAMVDFKAFVEIIDAIGGIDVNVENSFTDYRYPLGSGYQTVSFEAGPQTMDGETALKYSRSRHSTHNNEGTDFARARRQQKVIIALRDKLLSSESLTSPKTLVGIFSSVAGNVRLSEFTTKDIEAALKLANQYEENEGKAFSFVLDPTAGNNSIVERKNLESGAYAIGPTLGLGEYEDIKEYVRLIINSPEIYDENARILVYDTGAGFKDAQDMTEILKEELPYINILFSGTLYSDKEEVVVFSHQDEKETNNFSYTLTALSEVIKPDLVENPEYITTNLNGEDVTILLGKNLELKED
jgi:LCP family protein required for cell wall assembly